MKKNPDLIDEGSGQVQIGGLKGPAKWQFHGIRAHAADGEENCRIDGLFEVVQWIVTFDIADIAEQDEAVERLIGHRDSDPPAAINLRIDPGEGGEKVQRFVGQTHETMYIRECDESRDQTTVIVSNSFEI